MRSIMKLKDITDFFKTQPLMYLATSENNQPHVRPMALIYYNDQSWCCSIGGRPKIDQIKNNNKIEFAVIAPDREDMSTIRGRGKASIEKNLDVKKELSEFITWFSGYWDSYEDPNFVLIRLDLEKIEVQVPKNRIFYTFNLEDGSVTAIKK